MKNAMYSKEKMFCVLQKKVLSFGPNRTVEVWQNSLAKPNVWSVTTNPTSKAECSADEHSADYGLPGHGLSKTRIIDILIFFLNFRIDHQLFSPCPTLLPKLSAVLSRLRDVPTVGPFLLLVPHSQMSI